MTKYKIYLDNCAYNRPFDDKDQLAIRMETEAKLKIQEDIRQLQQIAVKPKDSLHLACAIESGCRYFITTDKALLRKAALILEINVINPIDFIRIEEGAEWKR